MQDRYENRLTTQSAKAADAFGDGLDRLLSADAGIEQAFLRATEEDPGFALAHLGVARARQMWGRGSEVAAPLAKARQLAADASTREASQIHAFGLMMDGKGGAAFDAIKAHLATYPKDAMTAQTCMGVFGLIGFSGRKDRESEQLAFTKNLEAHYGDDWWFQGQHAFALLEMGDLDGADRAISRSLAANPKSANGAHIRAHLYYENGASDAGYAYLSDWRKGYDRAGLLHCHVSWHVALWALEQGDIDGMWAEFEANLAHQDAPSLNALTDMASILYRAELSGVEVSAERWRCVSDYAAKRFPKAGLSFADAHAAIAFAMAGDVDELARLKSDVGGAAGDVVAKVAHGFEAIAAGNWSVAEAHLNTALGEHARLGGSRAQRDIVEFALANALMRQGRADEAKQVLSRRRPASSRLFLT